MATNERKTRIETLEARVAAAERKGVEEVDAREKATLAANVLRLPALRGLDSVQRRRVENVVENRRTRCKRAGEDFNWHDVARSAIHKETKGAVAPVLGKGEPFHPSPLATPRTFRDVSADREAYRARLRELGLLDPATASIPGDGGGLTGGPVGR